MSDLRTVRPDRPIFRAILRTLREAGRPLRAAEIVQLAGATLGSSSHQPQNTVARDLSLHLKRYGAKAKVRRVAPGLYTLAEDAVAS